MKIFDGHCDVLWKLWEKDRDFYNQHVDLHVHYANMKKAEVKVQTFAIYIPEKVKKSERFSTALTMVDLFYEKVIKDQSCMVPILGTEDLLKVKDSAKRGGFLSLEGAEALEGSLRNLRILYRLGVRSLGLTWNHRNEAGDGCGVENPAGLSQFGKELISEANRLGMVIDVSHLGEPGFWEVAQLSSYPIIASHSNCRAIFDHPRNLTDDQIRKLISMRGVIGLTFVPQFVSNKESVTITDFIKHIEHILALGGEDHLAFGSDFDGIDQTIQGLNNQGDYVHLREILAQHFTTTQLNKWFWGNWQRVFLEVLKK